MKSHLIDAAALKRKLVSFASKIGADACGVADVSLLRELRTEPSDLLSDYQYAISLAVRLSDGVLDAIKDQPTPLYQQHYFKVNASLDNIALRVMQFLQNAGYRALPIPASHLLDKVEYLSYVSHKAIAIAAGIGWQGKSLLVIHPKFGPRIRLVSVLTNADVLPDKPLKNLCARCSKCAKACPAGAIKDVNTSFHYENRDQALYFSRCVDKVVGEFSKLPHLEAPICGICIRACPYGQKASKPGKKNVLRETS